MTNLKDAIAGYLTKHPPAKELFSQLLQAGDIYLIGGVLREFCDNGDVVTLRDIDIVVDVKNSEYWAKTLEDYALKSNRFGGHKLYCSGLLIDTWALDQTWAFREGIIEANPVDYVSLLPETVFLNVDAIIYDWNRECWYNQHYLEAMESRILDVVLSENPQIALNLVRAFVLQERYQMTLSSRLREIICAQRELYPTTEDFVVALMEEQRQRYCRDIVSQLTITTQIENVLKRI